MYLGLDLGTSGLKGVVIDDDQNVAAVAEAPLSVLRPQEGWSEQVPAEWIAAVERVLDELSSKITMSRVQGIGLSGQMHGATVLDESDEVLRPSILWNDTRSSVEASEMDADPVWRSTSGNIVFPGFTAPKLKWMQTHEPNLFDGVHKVLLPKDYVRLWLTGEYISDMSDSAGTSWLDPATRDWSDTLLGLSNLDRGQMPSLVEGSDPGGKLREEIASRWGFSSDVVVAGGGGDNAASGIGVGVIHAGQAFVSLGTSGVLFAATESYAPAPETAVHTFCHALPGKWHQMGVVLSAADSLNWFADLLDSKSAELTEELDVLEAPGKAIFLPHLGGERTPLNDADIRGAFIGLEHATGRREATRAVIEGIAFSLCDCRDALAATGTEINGLLAVGGGSRSEYWLKVLATALDVPIQLPEAGDFGGAFGAARLGLMAATGAGSEVAQQPPIAKTIEPDASLTSAFSEAHHRYHAAQDAIRGLT